MAVADRSWRQTLDETDWASLSHAYGPASDTPAHLRALVAGGPTERRAAGDHLVSAIVHQGTSWPATYAATSVILGMLQDLEIADAIRPSQEVISNFVAEIEESLLQFPDSDWPKMEAMAARAAAQPAADWPNLDDEELVNAHWARAMIRLRGLLPVIQAYKAE